MNGDFSKEFVVSTDVATIVIFHPDDLLHAAEWSIAWYSMPFIYQAESAEGRLIAWDAGNDGTYKLRATSGDLTEREKRYLGPEWTFPLRVRHGRVFFDNTDALPGVEQMTLAENQPENWLELENGDYAVTVSAVEWDAEPGAEANGFETLPNYVIRFARQDAPIAPAQRPPSLLGTIDSKASDKLMTGGASNAPKPVDYDRIYPAFASADIAPPGGDFSSQGEADVELAIAPGGDSFALFDQPFIVAPVIETGALAVIARCNGTNEFRGQARNYSFRARAALRIVAIEGHFIAGQVVPPQKTGLFRWRAKPSPAGALLAVRVAPLPADAGISEDALGQLGHLKTQVLRDLADGGPVAAHLGGVANYEALHLEWLSEAPATIRWMIDNFPLDAETRLGIAAAPPSDQVAALSAAHAALYR